MADEKKLASTARVVEPETMFSVTLRRTKYAVTVFLVGSLFLMFWRHVLLAMVGITGPGPLAFGLIVGLQPLLALAALLAISVMVGVLLTHPDTPHTGIFCAFMGLIALSIRAGAIDFPLHLTWFSEGQVLLGTSKSLFQRLAMECGLYAVLAGAANVVGTHLHRRFFNNAAWLQRLGSHRETADVIAANDQLRAPVVEAALTNPRANEASEYWISAFGALAITGGLAAAIMMLLLRNSAKGQALFACFAAFAGGAFLAQQFFPKTPAWAVWMAAPLAGAAIFLIANADPRFPGHVLLAPARALPLDYLSAGVPGAIVGYYSSLKWQIHQMVHES